MSRSDGFIRVSSSIGILIQKTQVKIVDCRKVRSVTLSLEEWETLKEAIRHDAFES